MPHKQLLGTWYCQATKSTYEFFLVSDQKERCTMTEWKMTLPNGEKRATGRIPLHIARHGAEALKKVPTRPFEKSDT